MFDRILPAGGLAKAQGHDGEEGVRAERHGLDAGAWRSQDELNTIRCKFAAKGLSAPEVVFWNVGAPASTPVVEPQENAGGGERLLKCWIDRLNVCIPLVHSTEYYKKPRGP